jgi:hypothetical protein
VATLAVTFNGLCAFVRRTSNVDVLCHPERGAHEPVLTIPIKYIELDVNEWSPNLVGRSENGDEIGMWTLRGEVLQLGAGNVVPKFAAGNPRCLDMVTIHPGCAAVDDGTARSIVLPEGAIVRLWGGSFGASADRLRLIVKQGGNTSPADDYAGAIAWSGDLDDPNTGDPVLPTNKRGQKIALSVAAGAVTMAVTNVAKVPFTQGLSHFDHYYDLITGVSPSDRATLLSGQAGNNVYDCVPPVVGP